MSARMLIRGAPILAVSAAIAGALVTAPVSGARSSAPTHSHIYWSEDAVGKGPAGPGINSIWRTNLNGKSVKRNFIANLNFPAAVAVAGGHIYWSESEGDTIGRADLNGTHLKRTLIVADADALAVTSHYIYWTESAYSPNAAAVWRADLDGSHAQKLFSIGASTYIGGLAVDRNHIFWTNRDAGTIGRANLNGSDVKLSFITGLTHPTGLALDSQHLYWASDHSSIGRAGIGGSHVVADFIKGADEPLGVAVGAGHLYWANDGSGTIGRARSDGTDVLQDFITARVRFEGYNGADPVDIAVGP